MRPPLTERTCHLWAAPPRSFAVVRSLVRQCDQEAVTFPTRSDTCARVPDSRALSYQARTWLRSGHSADVAAPCGPALRVLTETDYGS